MKIDQRSVMSFGTAVVLLSTIENRLRLIFFFDYIVMLNDSHGYKYSLLRF